MERPRNVYEHLRVVRQRPAMYLGTADVLRLEHYLRGYDHALSVHRIAEPDGPPLHLFYDWTREVKDGRVSRGWARWLLETCASEAEALERAFELLEEFGSLQLEDGPAVELPPGLRRTDEFRRFNGEGGEMPAHIQLMYLRPGDATFARFRRVDGLSYDRDLGRDTRGPLRSIEWEYGPEVARALAKESGGGGA